MTCKFLSMLAIMMNKLIILTCILDEIQQNYQESNIYVSNVTSGVPLPMKLKLNCDRTMLLKYL